MNALQKEKKNPDKDRKKAKEKRKIPNQRLEESKRKRLVDSDTRDDRDCNELSKLRNTTNYNMSLISLTL